MIGSSNRQRKFTNGPISHAVIPRWRLPENSPANTPTQLGTTYVAVVVGQPPILGYYMLAPSHFQFANAPAKLLKGLPKHPVPSLLVARLAVTSLERDKGLAGICSWTPSTVAFVSPAKLLFGRSKWKQSTIEPPRSIQTGGEGMPFLSVLSISRTSHCEGLLNVEASQTEMAPIGRDCHCPVLYAIACTQPGTVVGIGHWQGPATGLALLLFGWGHGLPAVLPWLSNFLWLAGLVLLTRGGLAGRWHTRQ